MLHVHITYITPYFTCSLINSPSGPSTTAIASTSVSSYGWPSAGTHQPPLPFPVFNVTAPSDDGCDTEDDNSDVIDADQDAIVDHPDPKNRSAPLLHNDFHLYR